MARGCPEPFKVVRRKLTAGAALRTATVRYLGPYLLEIR